MLGIRTIVRSGTAASALALGLALTACTGPAGTAPTVAACPDGFLEAANAAALEQGIGVTFAPSSAVDFEPQAVLSLITATCFLGFQGDIGSDHAEGAFVFTTEPVDADALGAAVEGLGYQESDTNSWFKAESVNATEADVLTLSTPSSDGLLLDLAEIYPEAKHVIASFHVTAG